MCVRYYVFLSDGPFLRDYMKTEIDQLNVLTDLHVNRIHSAPGF